MMKLIHSFTYCLFPLASPAPAPLCALLATLARYWNWAREGLPLEPIIGPRKWAKSQPIGQNYPAAPNRKRLNIMDVVEYRAYRKQLSVFIEELSMLHYLS